MAKKSYNYAQLEGVAQEMRANADMVFFYEYQVPTATLPTGEVLDLAKEFGEHRTSGRGWPIDEQWIVGVAIGAAAAGSKSVARIPSMAPIYAIEYIQNQAGKIRSMTGGQASMPFVLWQDGAGRSQGSAGDTDVWIRRSTPSCPASRWSRRATPTTPRADDRVDSRSRSGHLPRLRGEGRRAARGAGRGVKSRSGRRSCGSRQPADDRGLAPRPSTSSVRCRAGEGRHQRRVHRSPHAEAARRRRARLVGPQDETAARRRARPLHRRLRITRHRRGGRRCPA